MAYPYDYLTDAELKEYIAGVIEHTERIVAETREIIAENEQRRSDAAAQPGLPLTD